MVTPLTYARGADQIHNHGHMEEVFKMTIEMTTENYNVWIGTLKVGDKVALLRSSFGEQNVYFTEIEKITPKRAIRVKWNPYYLFKDGEYSFGGFGKYGNTTFLRLVPITQELKEKHTRKVRIDQIEEFHNWNTLDNETITAIHELLFKNKPLPMEKNEVQT